MGILTGILTFSRFVKYLLHKHKNKTIVSLSGLIIGSLPILIPFEITELNPDYVISNNYFYLFWFRNFSVNWNKFYVKK